ncbi:hypothetical protein RI367_001957 [Sorochytrium milnesiophthora]
MPALSQADRLALKRKRLRSSVAKLLKVDELELLLNDNDDDDDDDADGNTKGTCCLCLLNLGSSGVPLVSNDAFDALVGSLDGKLDAWMVFGRSFSFIRFASVAAATAARDTLNGHPCPAIDGRSLVVEFANEATVLRVAGPSRGGFNAALSAPELDGLSFYPDVITEQEEQDVLAAIRALPAPCWVDVQHRRVVLSFLYYFRASAPVDTVDRGQAHFGYIFDYPTFSIARGSSGASARYQDNGVLLPAFLDFLYTRLPLSQFARPPNQATVSVYPAGAGIAFHADVAAFGPVVAALSLQTGAEMEFRVLGEDVGGVYLRPRSVLVLERAARYQAEHGIKERKGDWVQEDEGRGAGRTVERGERVSIVWRWVPETP